MAAQFSKIFGAEGETQGENAGAGDETAAAQPAQNAETAPANADDASQFETFLGSGCSVEGRLVCKGPARLSGTVKGEVAGDGLVAIDDGAVVTADVNVREASISGRVVGNVSAASRVTLGSTALIDGDIKTPSLSIAEGAQIMGRIEVKPGAGDNARPKTEAAPSASPAPSAEPKPVAAAPFGDNQS